MGPPMASDSSATPQAPVMILRFRIEIPPCASVRGESSALRCAVLQTLLASRWFPEVPRQTWFAEPKPIKVNDLLRLTVHDVPQGGKPLPRHADPVLFLHGGVPGAARE